MDKYEVMAGKMAPLTDGAHRKWGFAGKVETSIWHGWNTRQTVIRRSTATWIR